MYLNEAVLVAIKLSNVFLLFLHFNNFGGTCILLTILWLTLQKTGENISDRLSHLAKRCLRVFGLAKTKHHPPKSNKI